MTYPVTELRQIASIDRMTVQPGALQGQYVGLEHIDSDGSIDLDHGIPSESLGSSKFAFTHEHILFGKLRPYLRKVALPEFGGICSTDLLPIRPKKGVDRRYLFHYLRTPAIIELATLRSSGANLPRISPASLAEFPVPVPSFEEQKRIAAILDKAEAIRRKREQTIELADEFLRSLFLDMFGDSVTNQKRWPVHSLEDLLSEGPQNGLYRPSSDYGTGTPIVRIDSFEPERGFEVKNLKRVRISEEVQQIYGVQAGNILLNRVNSRSHLGKNALVPALSEPVVFESNMMRLKLRLDRLHPAYAHFFLRTPRVKRQVQNLAKDAVNQASINQQDVKSLEFLLPPISRQDEFAAALNKLEHLRTYLHHVRGQEQALVVALSGHAFRGEL